MQQSHASPAAMKPSQQLEHPLWTHVPTTADVSSWNAYMGHGYPGQMSSLT